MTSIKIFNRGRAENPPTLLAGSKKTDGVKGVRKRARVCENRAKGVRGYFKNVRTVNGMACENRAIVRDWTEKYPDIQPYERLRPLKRVIMAGLVVSVVCRIFAHAQPQGTLMLGCLMVAALVGFDCFQVFSRILATYSRGLIAVSCISWAVVCAFPIVESIGIAFAVSAITVLGIWLLNLKWLSAQVYRRSDTVKKALSKCQDEDIDNLWISTGAAAVRAAWWECGVDADNEGYDAAKKSAFVIGYSMAKEISADTIKQVAKMKAENAELKADLEQADRSIEEGLQFLQERENLYGELEELRARLETAEKQAAAGRDAMERERNLYFENCRLEAQVLDAQLDLSILRAELEAAQVEAPAQVEASAQAPAELSEEERTDVLLAEAIEKGYGIKRAADYAGCTHYRARTYYAAHKEEVEQAKEANKKIVSLEGVAV